MLEGKELAKVIEGLTLNGRFPAGRATHIGTRVESVRTDYWGVTLKLGHEVHPDYWQEIRIPGEVLSAFYAMYVEGLKDQICESNDPPFDVDQVDVKQLFNDNAWEESYGQRVAKEDAPIG